MQIIYTEAHRQRSVKTELAGGQLISPHECPQRVDYILDRLQAINWHKHIEAPIQFSEKHLLSIHSEDYITFLKNCWQDWLDEGHNGEIIPYIWPSRAAWVSRPTTAIAGRIGYYAMGADTTISAGTWEAAQASANVALTAASKLNDGYTSSFALCRPPGHHAGVDIFGGYCFLNNAALAAQYLRDQGQSRVAILDIDFHHGNGTQQIFYQRDDVFVASLHGDPDVAFPYFLGYKNEQGQDKGCGYNQNYPLPKGCQYPQWKTALLDALKSIRQYKPESLIISLGVDTYENDPISFFKLASKDFIDIGIELKKMNLPTMFCMEGGYAVDQIGVNVVNVLEGFENG